MQPSCVKVLPSPHSDTAAGAPVSTWRPRSVPNGLAVSRAVLTGAGSDVCAAHYSQKRSGEGKTGVWWTLTSNDSKVNVETTNGVFMVTIWER